MRNGFEITGRMVAPFVLFGLLSSQSVSVQGQVVVKDHVTDSSLWSTTARISNWEWAGINKPDFFAACAFTGNGGTLMTVEGIFWSVDGGNVPNGALWANIDFQIIFYESTAAYQGDPVNGTSKHVFDTPDNVDWLTPIASFHVSFTNEDFDLHRFSIDVSGLGITTTAGQVQLVALTPIGDSLVDGETGMMFSTGGIGSIGTEPDWWAQVALTMIGPDSLPNLSAPHDYVAYRVEVGNAPCPTDFDFNGITEVPDLLSLLGRWGPCAAPCPEDLSPDGVVEVSDLLILLGAWGPCS